MESVGARFAEPVPTLFPHLRQKGIPPAPTIPHTYATFLKNSDICRMEVFFAYEADGRFCRLDADESGHCCRVLRHRAGDEIHVIDGLGSMFLSLIHI